MTSIEIRVLGPSGVDGRIGVFSIVHEMLSPHELAGLLEARGILCRAGIHCAPRAHRTFGTLGDDESSAGGAARLSFGVMNTLEDADLAVEALRAIALQPASGRGATSTH